MTIQPEFDFGKRLRDEGIEKAVAHAELVNPGWKEKCYELFKRFLVGRAEPFRVEAFREWVKDYLVSPPHARAFGSIVVRAKREGIIKHVGYDQVKNPKAHGANCSLWARV